MKKRGRCLVTAVYVPYTIGETCASHATYFAFTPGRVFCSRTSTQFDFSSPLPLPLLAFRSGAWIIFLTRPPPPKSARNNNLHLLRVGLVQVQLWQWLRALQQLTTWPRPVLQHAEKNVSPPYIQILPLHQMHLVNN